MSAATNKPLGATTGSIRDAGGGRFTLDGAVTMATVTGLRSAGLQAFARGDQAHHGDIRRARGAGYDAANPRFIHLQITTP